jgi:stearoyl-CoA desaturase (delta-9 desaturase)
VEQPQVKTDYPTIIIFLSMMVATVVGVPLFGYFYGYSALDWTMFIVLYLITGLGITVGYHRLISHRSFECKPWVKGCLLVAGGWALENSALRWCSDHIRHHARCDGQEDPYNAKKGFWYSHCGWLFIKSPYRDEKYEKQLRKDPLIMWQHRYYIPVVLSGLALPFIVGFFYGGWMSGLSCFILAGVGRTFFVLNSTFCINSICHMWGEQPHGTGDSSRDSWWISLITFGEGYHNYHHMFLRDYRNGAEWYHFDPSKWLIFTLSKMRLAYNLQRHQG